VDSELVHRVAGNSDVSRNVCDYCNGRQRCLVSRLSRQASDFTWAGAYLADGSRETEKLEIFSEQGRDDERDSELQKSVSNASDSLESKVSWCGELLRSATRQICWPSSPKAPQWGPAKAGLSRLSLKNRHVDITNGASWHFSTTITEYFWVIFSSFVRRLPGYNTQRRGTARIPSPKFLTFAASPTLDMITLSTFFIYQLMHKSFALKETLKFTLKSSDLFRFNHHHQGGCYLSFAKVTVAKTTS
jgi:hypothetical protein